MSTYFRQSNGFRYVKILDDTIDNPGLIEVNLYELNTSIEFRKMEAHLTDCLPCTAKEFSEAVVKAKLFLQEHLHNEDVQSTGILDKIPVTAIVLHYGEEALLREIGKDCAMGFWESL